MFLTVGLGNHTQEYDNTRHNVGFMVIDKLNQLFRVPLKQINTDSSIPAIVSQIRTPDDELICAKPLTFMNNSGHAVKNLMSHYKIEANNLIVINDDLDLDLGKVRIKKGSGSGGHLGVKSIIDNLGRQDFIRVRVGVGRPPARKNPADYVLDNFKKAEIEELEFALLRAADAIIDLTKYGLEKVMNKYN